MLDANARFDGSGVGGPTPNDPLRGTPPSALDAWSHTTVDLRRLKRLLGGACAAAVLLGVAGYGAASAAHDPAPVAAEEEEEKVVDVSLVETPPEEEEAPTEEEPPPSSDPAPVARSAPAVITQVQNVPKNLPPPGPVDPYGNDTPSPYFGDGTPGGGPSGPARRVGPRPKPQPTAVLPKPEPAKKKKEEKVETDPPKCKRRGIDSARAKAMNVEGKVMVTYTVTASGDVVNVSATSGPPELRPLAVAAVQSWRCEPARRKSDGGAVSVTKKVPLTVTLQ